MSSVFVVPKNIYFSEENACCGQNHEFTCDIHLVSIHTRSDN